MRGDSAWVKQFVGDIEGVLTYYERSVDESVNLLGSLDQRNFIDWSIHYGSVPQRKPEEVITHSAMMTLYYVHTLDCAVELYSALGENKKAEHWKTLADTLRRRGIRAVLERRKTIGGRLSCPRYFLAANQYFGDF